MKFVPVPSSDDYSLNSPDEQPSLKMKLSEIAAVFLRLGFTAFGGPAAHIAMYHDEFVKRREWLTDTYFLDLLAATNLIPGPNSTEMAIHIGYVRAGLPGLVVAGLCFICPSMLIVLGIAWFYVRYGSLPQIASLIYGIEPVMIAIILQALVRLGQVAVRGWPQAVLGVLIVLLYFTGAEALLLLFGGAMVYLLFQLVRTRQKTTKSLALFPLMIGPSALLSAVAYNPLTLFLTFLKIGAILYGSGYVLLAFLQSEFVSRLGWLTSEQLLEAISIGQVTPGPVFSTATFIGYILGGLSGGLLATIGIFFPSFIFVALSNPFIERIRSMPRLGDLLDGLNITSLGLMAGVMLALGRSALVDPLAAIIALSAGVALFKYKINSTWLILAGGLVGFAKYLIK